MLKRVSIQNFKSLKDVTLDLQQVNLLIGPNNSGKTNFLKALEFCHQSEPILDSENLVPSAFLRAESTSSEYRESEGQRFFTTSYQKKVLSEIKIDLYFKTDGFHETLFTIKWDPISRILQQKIGGEQEYNSMSSSDLSFFLKSRHNLDRIIIYKPDPNKLSRPAPVSLGDNIIAADASNLIAFFDKIRDEYYSVYEKIKSDLFKCLPEFNEINFQNVKPTEELIREFGDKTFKRIGLTNGRQKVKYWADELSEGTLYFLALICIINQPIPPEILLLEEPEKGIHPRRIKEVIEFIRQLAAEKGVQVIMTTHSPLVLNEFNDSPECVFIFDKDEEGATHVKNLKRDVIEPDLELSRQNGVEPPNYTDSLGDSWTIGFLGGVPK
jgi:AAA15 family ATPase/GTPase